MLIFISLFLRYILRGFTDSYIHYVKSEDLWKLSSYKTNDSYATLKYDSKLYPFGKYEWTIYNDNCKKKSGALKEYKTLSLTSCKIDEFNCYDGTWYLLLNHQKLL